MVLSLLCHSVLFILICFKSSAALNFGSCWPRFCQKENLVEDSQLWASPTDITSDDALIFTYTPDSLDHLQNIELPDDYSRSWSVEKTKSLAAGMVIATILGFTGEFVMTNLFHVEKAGLLFAAVGMASGWTFTGGSELTKAEQAPNGGYDAKLVADRPVRLRTTLQYLEGKKHVKELPCLRDENQLLEIITKVHDKNYIDMIRQRSLESDRPNRLNPLSPTTLIDEHSYKAALSAVNVWLDAVDAALSTGVTPRFGLVRPPSHHACRSKGMGGCLLNSVAIAAEYALSKGAKSVAILDIDAHHGNGIAHCVQDNPRIKFVSLHEAKTKLSLSQPKPSPENPRTPASDDVGPLGNIMNINLDPETNWSNYEIQLKAKALPFIQGADILLVAAGFDTMANDWSSSLQLNIEDYASLGRLLRDRFDDRIAFGLEGGYAYENHELAKAIEAFSEA
mmetsp:Transcript_26089/g.39481  ORF Transcript_26089/g.39481 Transcript_26089/m.39481 type:complete len:452 (-) Transcript_26089:1-1356(-)